MGILLRGVQEWTQAGVTGPEQFAPAPAGPQPQGPDTPGNFPTGLQTIPPGTVTAQNLPPVPAGHPQGGQYVQRYSEMYVESAPAFVAGLRGSARRLPHFGDPLIEPSLGPIKETNGGYPWTWLRSVVKSYAPAREYQSITTNYRQKTYNGRFHAHPVQEINAKSCT